MSTVNVSDPGSKAASKKRRKSKKKANGKAHAGPEATEVNGTRDETVADAEEDEAGEAGEEQEEDEVEDIDSPRKGSVPNHVQSEDTLHMPSSPPDSQASEAPDTTSTPNGGPRLADGPARDDQSSNGPIDTSTASEPGTEQPSEPVSDTTARLDAMQQERDSLRNEVSQLRQSLESLQHQHSEERLRAEGELKQTSQGREHAEAQYRNLLGKVNTIRSQLGERLKADAEELEQARGRIEELESEKATAQEDNSRLQESVSALNTRIAEQETEVETLRNRTNLSATNWTKERDDLVAREAYIREEYEVARQAMQDWEILATEERSRREVLADRLADLEDQLGGTRESYERVRNEAELQNSTVDGLQRALREVQEERRRELRELVEQSQSQLEALRTQSQAAEHTAAELRQQLDETKLALERALPFEKDAKDKSLQLGKLRHEAVILNDHLTKALRFLKRGKVEDHVDRQLVTNHFLHFLALDRGDPKKFQVLQLIAALLGWSEQQKEQAGLLRAGTGAGLGGSLRSVVGAGSFRRAPSTPSLSADFVPESPGGGAGRESLAELWSEFLERESEAGGGASRRGSVAARAVRSSSLASQGGGSLAGAGMAGGGRGASPELRRKESEGTGI